MQESKKCGFKPWVGRIHWRRAGQPTLVFLPGEFHGQRSLTCHGPLGRTELDTTEATLHDCTHILIYEAYFFSSVQLLNRVQHFVTPRTAAHQPSLSVTNSRNLFKFMSIELVMPSNRLILFRSLLFLPSIFPSIRVFFQ